MLLRSLLQLGSRSSLFTGKKDADKTAKETGKAENAIVKFLFLPEVENTNNTFKEMNQNEN